MSYKAQEIKDTDNPKEIVEQANRELKAIEQAINAPGRYPISKAEPSKPRPGTTVYADGVSWDPGGGEGIYVFTVAGDWQKLEYGAFQAQDPLLQDISGLTDPGVDRLLFWDDSFGEIDWLEIVAPLRITSTQFSIDTATRTQAGITEEATEAEVYAATDNKYLDAGHLSSAAAPVALTYASSFSWSWTDFINGVITCTGDIVIGNPTNEIPGTYRAILLKGNNSTPRAVTFGSEFGGEDPGITDLTSTKFYKLVIACEEASFFLVSAQDATPP